MANNYVKYEEGMWSSENSWEETMKTFLIENIKEGAAFESEIERAWQLTGLEFDDFEIGIATGN